MNMIAPRRQRLVLVGNGIAGVRTLEEILARTPDAFDITVFGAEPHGNYNRIMLSPVLAGEKQYRDIVTHNEDWYAAHEVHCRFGRTVTKIDRTEEHFEEGHYHLHEQHS